MHSTARVATGEDGHSGMESVDAAHGAEEISVKVVEKSATRSPKELNLTKVSQIHDTNNDVTLDLLFLGAPYYRR